MESTLGQAAAGGNYQEDVSIQEAVTRFFKNYINFEGRSNRGEYWKAYLGIFLALILASIVDALIGVPLVTMILYLAILVPGLAIGARRLHDIGKSGWWLLLGLIPLAGLVLLYWFVQKPDPQPNRFG